LVLDGAVAVGWLISLTVAELDRAGRTGVAVVALCELFAIRRNQD
jgi:hypothetical protein